VVTRSDADAFVHDGVNLNEKYYHVVQEESGFPRHENFEVLVELSEQILYLIANAYLYAPHALASQQGYVSHHNEAGEPRYLIYHEVYGKRYDMYVDCVAEKFYAYWTRLAMLLNHYLTRPLKANSVDFSRVIDQLGVQLFKHQEHIAFK
jgi:hypothetical protein